MSCIQNKEDIQEVTGGVYVKWISAYRWNRYILTSDTHYGARLRLFQAWKRLKRALYKTLLYLVRYNPLP